MTFSKLVKEICGKLGVAKVKRMVSTAGKAVGQKNNRCLQTCNECCLVILKTDVQRGFYPFVFETKNENLSRCSFCPSRFPIVFPAIKRPFMRMSLLDTFQKAGCPSLAPGF